MMNKVTVDENSLSEGETEVHLFDEGWKLQVEAEGWVETDAWILT